MTVGNDPLKNEGARFRRIFITVLLGVVAIVLLFVPNVMPNFSQLFSGSDAKDTPRASSQKVKKETVEDAFLAETPWKKASGLASEGMSLAEHADGSVWALTKYNIVRFPGGDINAREDSLTMESHKEVFDENLQALSTLHVSSKRSIRYC